MMPRSKTLFWFGIASLIVCSVQAEPLASFPFTQNSLENGDFYTIPVTNYSTPPLSAILFPAGESFQEGYRMTLEPGEAAMLAAKTPVDANGKPVVITLEYSALDADRLGPQIAVVGLNAPDGHPDGQIGYFYLNKTRRSQTVERLHLVYQPPSGTFLPAVQASLDPDAEQETSIALYSLSVYPFEAADAEETNFYDFREAIDPLVVNVNNDAGTVQQDLQAQSMTLSAPGQGAAANFQLTPTGPINDTLMVASLDASKQSGADGMTAFVMEHAGQNLGLFVFNRDLPRSPEPVNLLAGGNFLTYRSLTYLYIQNGGGETETMTSIDNVRITSYPYDSITGLEKAAPTDRLPESLSVAMVMPTTLYGGSQNSLSVTAVDSESKKPVYFPFEVTLTQGGEQVSLAKGATNQQGLSTQTFALPQLNGGMWKVQMQSGEETVLSGEAAVKNNGVLLIYTDKPIYKPSQTMQGRVLFLNNALQPMQGDIELSIADAKGIKIHKEVIPANDYGVASFELPLANELNFGTWKITAKSGGENQAELDVEVDKYVLPAFEVNLNLDKDWYLVSERITGAIDSRYFFGKPVQGDVHIQALRYVAEWEEYATTDGRLENGIFAFDLPEVGYIAGTQAEEGAGTLQIKVTVTDDTGKEESTDALVRIVDSGVTLKLIPESSVVKPGMDQQLIIVTETPGGAPLSLPVALEISFTNESGDELGSISETINTENGIFLYEYEVPEKTQMAVITAKTDQDRSTAEESLLLYAAYSPGSYYIHLRQRNEGVLKAGDQAVFDLHATNPGTLYFDVYGDGRTLFSNAVEGNEISFTVTPEMSPSAKIVAYMIQPNNEISADVLPFDVDLTSSTSLEASFSAEEVKPGDPVSLTIQSEGQSMVGLALVDESVFALVENRLNLQNVFAELERIFMAPQVEVHANPDSVWIGRETLTGGKGALDVFAENNLQILTSGDLTVPKAKEIDPWSLWDNQLIRKNLPFPPFLEMVDDAAPTGGFDGGGAEYQEPERVRTFFPETWLWQPELLTDENGAAVLDLTAPDSITTWKLQAVSTSDRGLGITDGSLRVFQDFFAEPDLPYAVIRGDEFPLSVRIFNYIDDEQTIRVTLENTEDLGLQGDPVQEVTIAGQSAGSVQFTLSPTNVGLFPISLIAQSSQRADAIRKNLRVEPEGIRKENVHNGVLKDDSEITIDLTFPEPFIREAPEPVGEEIEPIDDIIPPIIPPVIEIVPDSETLRIAVTPSLVGQSLDGLDDLLGMPYGCGEQNMIFMAPDVEVLRYLKASGQLNPEVRAKAEYFITTGYQRQLTFRHSDGSFSAFGEQDESGSLWLTAFVLSTFSNAREVRTIDEVILAQASQWITDHQLKDGSWEPVGFVIHQEMIGGMEGNLVLTAFVTNALLEYGSAGQAAVQSAVAFLESSLSNEKIDSYALAQIAYALTKAGSSRAAAAIDALLEQGKTDSNGLYWEPHAIETTGYAAMALALNDRMEAQPALQWLAAQRNSLGGYGGTQDTVVAFKALTAAAAKQSRDLDASIDVLVNGEVVHSFSANAENFDVLQSLELAPADAVTLKMSGKGSVMYQVVHGYNVPAYSEPVGSDMMLKVSYSSEHVAVDDIVDVNVVVEYMGMEEKTGMAIVDVSIPTGFGLVQESLDRVQSMEIIKRIEQAGRKVIFYVDHFTSGEILEFTFQVRALFPVKADSGIHSAYLYYDADVKAETGGNQLQVD
ncbi:MAG: alpha-2-macroglobulin [Candidatus Omnitrophica bacterium]|nr:alpha-2-macroglobulin [Candidatus Omnitrophota bacterium]